MSIFSLGWVGKYGVERVVDRRIAQSYGIGMSNTTTLRKSICLSVPSYARESYTWGMVSTGPYRVELFTDVMIDPDGTIRVWDEVACHYSVCGEVTDDQREWIEDAVAKVVAGTHYVAGGSLFEKTSVAA